MSDDIICDGVFQARVSSKRESKAGIFLTVEISADDYSPALAQLRAGSLLKMGWQELVDVSVQPIEIPSQRGTTLDQAFVEPTAAAARSRGDSRERPAQPKKRFEDLSLVQQCAMRCEDSDFIRFTCDRYPVRRGGSTTAEFVRAFCGVTSRKDIPTNRSAIDKWRELEAQYQDWLTDQKYGAARR